MKTDCRFFKGYLPCKYHKTEKVNCEDCSYYQRISQKILIIKLGAIGDVLRTTTILPALKQKYPHGYIIWLTRKESVDLFKNNIYVDRIIEYNWETALQLQIERYHLVINLDCENISSQIAALVKSNKKLGFGYNEQGFIYPFNSEAKRPLEMSLSDEIKKSNSQTYQEIIFNICQLVYSKKYLPVFNLDFEEITRAKKFAKKHHIKNNSLIIGLNPGAGKRWEQKKWTVQGYLKLVKLLAKKYKNVKILLFGSGQEKKLNQYLKKYGNKKLIDTGYNNTLREFASLLNLCDLVVTGDTLALHLAVSLRKKIVALFGPTSHAEVEMYGLGKKLYANLDCLCCYKNSCDKKPDCMDLLTAENVFSAIKELSGW